MEVMSYVQKASCHSHSVNRYFLSLAATVFAAGQPRRYNENSTVKGTISQSFYQVNAKTDVAVKRITVTGTLYEKGTFGTWQKVSSCSNTSTSSSCSASSNYNTKPGRSYRLECSATFTYSNSGTHDTEPYYQRQDLP